MRSDRETTRREREYEADTIRRLNRDDRMRRENELETGRYAEPRSWMDRTKDEIAAWFGSTDAMRRRQWDEAAGDHTGEGPVRQLDADGCAAPVDRNGPLCGRMSGSPGSPRKAAPLSRERSMQAATLRQ